MSWQDKPHTKFADQYNALLSVASAIVQCHVGSQSHQYGNAQRLEAGRNNQCTRVFRGPRVKEYVRADERAGVGRKREETANNVVLDTRARYGKSENSRSKCATILGWIVIIVPMSTVR